MSSFNKGSSDTSVTSVALGISLLSLVKTILIPLLPFPVLHLFTQYRFNYALYIVHCIYSPARANIVPNVSSHMHSLWTEIRIR